MEYAQPHRDFPSSIPTGVKVIATVFLLTAGYLGLLGGIMLASPGAVSMALGAPLLGGLELAGPYMFLLVAGVGMAIGWGLLRLNNWMRRAAALVALIGIVILVPSVSANAISLQFDKLAWGGLGMIVRVLIVWYLFQEPVAERFSR